MTDFLAPAHAELLARHHLADFESLWALQLEQIDEPNQGRGGYSSVCRLSLEGQQYYLKRQSNHLARSLCHPLGEPTFAREFRNIGRYQQLGIPALQAAFFGQRRVGREQRAILLTPALEGWFDLDHWLSRWAHLEAAQREAIVQAVGLLARQLHQHRLWHGCFYPKHLFLRPQATKFEACLIDLEKTRRPLFWRDQHRVRDLEPLVRRAAPWTETDLEILLVAYLGSGLGLTAWKKRLMQRRQHKAERR